MPRRNYARGRNRPRNHDDLRWLERKPTTTAAPAPAASAQAQRIDGATKELLHRAWCSDQRIGTFTGKLGDRLARCTTCGSITVLDALSEGA